MGTTARTARSPASPADHPRGRRDNYVLVNNALHLTYQTNSCALTHVLNRPDSHLAHGTSTCADNHCPASQRVLCASSAPPPVTPDDIQQHLVWLGVPTVHPIHWDSERRTATVEGALTLRDCNNSAQGFGIGVQAPRQTGDGPSPLILDTRDSGS
ncbi:hypothetical protein ACFVT1_36685 [Streptomyces sp. NPDC057963]|uniref:hypothetical protein n=1 Tax=Streptomyces sp. NPDC057963 TaxID=3346290 RepID=UPI0036E02AB0